ncbi:MAG: HAD family phosphatase, partial [Comamonadaceae bacterium]
MNRFEAILFDCDGVLVDSEPITNGVLRDMLAEAGWALTSEECMRIFIGKTVRSEAARIEAHTGQPLTDVWMADFYARRNTELDLRLTAIEHIHGTIERVHAHHGGRIA